MKWVELNKYSMQSDDNLGEPISVNSDNIIYMQDASTTSKVNCCTLYFLDQSSIRVGQSRTQVMQMINWDGAL